MEFTFSFKNLENTQSIQQYAEAKMREAVAKFVTKPISAQVAFEQLTHHRFTAKCVFNGGDGFNAQVDHEGKDLHVAIDQMIDKLSSQLRKQKEKLKAHKGKDTPKHDNIALHAPKTSRPKSGIDEIDAGDILKYEQARKRKTVG